MEYAGPERRRQHMTPHDRARSARVAALSVALGLGLAAQACVSERVYSERVAGLDGTVGGQRPLAALDASGDGRLDPNDWRTFEAIASAARAAATAAGKPIAPLSADFYDGPPKEAPPIFSFVKGQGAAVDVTAVPVERLAELAIEADWAARQARIAALRPRAADAHTVGGLFADTLAGYNPGEMAPTELCLAIDKLELGPYLAAGITPSAIFDLDSTVWDGNVTDGFLALLVERELAKPEAHDELKAYLRTLGGVDPKAIDKASLADNARLLFERATRTDIPKEHRVSLKDVFYRIVGLLEGMSLAEGAAAARATYEEGSKAFPAWKDRFFVDAGGCSIAEIITRLQKRGVHVHLLSATPDLLALEAARLLAVPEERVLGSSLEVKDGRYTGQVRESTYYTKGAITRQWLSAPPLMAFGDSPTSDYAMMLEAVITGFMINARDEFIDKDTKGAGSRLVKLSYPETVASAKQKAAPQPPRP